MSKIVFESDEVMLIEDSKSEGSVYYMIDKSRCVKVGKEENG